MFPHPDPGAPAVLRLLLVEDSPTDALLARDELSRAQGVVFEVVQVEFLHEALSRLETQRLTKADST